MPLRLPHPASPITHLSSLHHSTPIKFPTRPLLLSSSSSTFVIRHNYNTHRFHQKTATMSTKPTPVEQVQQASQHSKPCCTIPPIVSDKEYKPQGAYQTIDGVETYITGPTTAKTGIFVIADIFGFYPQTLQGADILTTSNHRVFIPDFFDGDPCPLEWYPPTPATADNLSAWFKKRGDLPSNRTKTLQLLAACKAHAPHITSWVGLGYCWGGKLIALTSGGEDVPWAASVQCHPAMVSAGDAEGIRIPHVLLASGDEDKAEVEKFEKGLKGEGGRKHVETFADMIHGWMAARGDLDDPVVVKEYERGYRIVLEFLEKNNL